MSRSAGDTALREPERVAALLAAARPRMTAYLRHCVGCSLCAESCFLYRLHGGAPRLMPAFKVLRSVGLLYRRGRRLDRAKLAALRDIVWHDCVLCGRCYCPVGVSVPAMIALARAVCRVEGIFPAADIAAPDRPSL